MADKSKPIRVHQDIHRSLVVRASRLATERGHRRLTLPDYLSEASTFFEQNRTRGNYKLTKPQLIDRLHVLMDVEAENAHSSADELLLEFIGDEDISKAFSLIKKWYA
jgi:hypothetical protein